MTSEELKKRTRALALRVIKMCDALPKGRTADVIGRQLIRSATSVGANYRAACRAKSTADFVAKMGIMEEECDECLYWMDLLIEAELVKRTRISGLMREANELLSITVSSIKTARRRPK